MSGTMDCCGQSDIGRKRTSNEDQFLIADICKSMRVHQTSLALDHQTRLFGETQGKLLAVADGMGGHEAGERASQLAIDGFVDYVLNRLSWFTSEGSESEEQFEEQLKLALLNCQRRIDLEIDAIPQRRGMGSTFTLAYIVWPKMFLVHVGDTRCYLLRDGNLQQLTRDHTMAELMSAVERGDDAQQVKGNDVNDPPAEPFANILWNVLGGGGQTPHPDATAIELRMGDTLLLCSDGLTNQVGRRRLVEILSSNQSTAGVTQQLIDAANSAGGSDNITVVVSRFVDRSDMRPQAEEIELPIEESSIDTADFEAPQVVA